MAPKPVAGGGLALVFSGGGAKGAFGVGVLYELATRFPGLRWDVVSGTSTGALITPFAALGSGDRAAVDQVRDLYLAIRSKDVIDSNFDIGGILGSIGDLPEGLYNFKPLARKIDRAFGPGRREALAASPVVAVVNAVSLQTGALVLCTQDRHRPVLEKWFEERSRSGTLPPWRFEPFARFPRMMVASASIPFAVSPVEEKRPGGVEQLVDGGVIDIAPLRAAIAAGATDAIVVSMSPLRPEVERGKKENPISVGLRAVDLLTAEILRNDVEYAEHLTGLRDLAAAVLESEATLPKGLKGWLGENRERLVKLSRKVPVETVLLQPPRPLGDTLDFDSVWPKGSGRNVMESRFEIGRETLRAALAGDTGLKEMVARHGGGATV